MIFFTNSQKKTKCVVLNITPGLPLFSCGPRRNHLSHQHLTCEVAVSQNAGGANQIYAEKGEVIGRIRCNFSRNQSDITNATAEDECWKMQQKWEGVWYMISHATGHCAWSSNTWSVASIVKHIKFRHLQRRHAQLWSIGHKMILIYSLETWTASISSRIISAL